MILCTSCFDELIPGCGFILHLQSSCDNCGRECLGYEPGLNARHQLVVELVERNKMERERNKRKMALTVKARDFLEQQIDLLRIQCPDHHSAMTGRRIEVKAGLSEHPIKIMYVGKCEQQDCGKWFEFIPPNTIMWP